MADTTTTTLSLVKPSPNDPAGADVWGPKLNGNADIIDNALTPPTAAQAKTLTENTHALTSKSLADASVPQVLTASATPAWDMSLGVNAELTLNQNAVLATPTNMKKGLYYTLRVIQDATGSRTLAYPASFNWGANGAPVLTTTAAKYDLITLYCVDTAGPIFIGSFWKGL